MEMKKLATSGELEASFCFLDPKSSMARQGE
jgi:hypothetical protein